MSDKNQDFQKNVSEQGGVEGQRKEVNVEDYPKAGSIRSNSQRCGFSSRQAENNPACTTAFCR